MPAALGVYAKPITLRGSQAMQTKLLLIVTVCLLIAANPKDRAVKNDPGSDWPQWLGPMRDGVWRETGLIDKFPTDGAKVLWRTPLGAGYSGPAVAGERVFVMDRERAKDSEGN